MISNRIGTFLILVGLLLVSLYIYSDMVKAPVCNLLLIGGSCLALGIFLWFRNPASPPQESGRFRILRKREKSKKN